MDMQHEGKNQVLLTIHYSVRSREGRRNRAPPPRIRYNKDGKKLAPPQAAKAM